MRILPILPFQTTHTLMSVCPQIGLNITQICLAKECHEDEVSETGSNISLVTFPSAPTISLSGKSVHEILFLWLFICAPL